MKLETIYKRAKTGKIQEWTIEIEGNRFRTISGQSGGVLTSSEWTTCEAKSYCTAEEQAVKEAEAMRNIKIAEGCFEDIEEIDNTKYFEPMLAVKIQDLRKKNKVNFPYYDQPKLDGMRDITNKTGMWTRKGKRIISAPHIVDALRPLFDKYPDLILDGELYCDKLADDFNKIMSLARKTKPTPEDLEESAQYLEYHIYDLPSAKGTFSQRYAELCKLDLPECCKVVKTTMVHNDEELMEHFYQFLGQGYEGQILRVDGPYENKRSKYLIKHKQFDDAEFTIIGVLEGKGNYSNKVGKLEFNTKYGVYFTAPINATWEKLAELWQRREEIVGKSATVKFFGYTPDGSVRFPKVIDIAREDFE